MTQPPPARLKSAAEAVFFPIADGWRTGTKLHEVGVAHFYLNGYSLCHSWLTTKLDRPARPADTRCEACKERTSV